MSRRLRCSEFRRTLAMRSTDGLKGLSLLSSIILRRSYEEADGKEHRTVLIPSRVVVGHGRAADAVITWNENAAKAATAACIHISGNGLAESRMYVMVHVAVHDAVNAIDRRSRPYAFDANVNGLVSVDAAVAAAAHDVLVSVIAELPESPACVASGILEADALYAAALMPIPDGLAKIAGVAVGQAAAAAIVALRAGDGSETTTWLDFDYPQGTEPGEWRFTPDGPLLAFASNYGQVRPFVLRHSGQFWPGPPYPLSSKRYADDYNEIKLIGGDGITTLSTRTPDQTEIGVFWIESSPLAWNRLARAVSVDRGFDLWENARLFGSLTWPWRTGTSRHGKSSITTASGARSRRSGRAITTAIQLPRPTRPGHPCNQLTRYPIMIRGTRCRAAWQRRS